VIGAGFGAELDALRQGVSRSYFTRLVRLSYLAPRVETWQLAAAAATSSNEMYSATTRQGGASCSAKVLSSRRILMSRDASDFIGW
jgi:hypothetical protein